MVDAETTQLAEVLRNLMIEATITDVKQRPAVTSYTVELSGASRVSRVMALSRDIARGMAKPTAYVAQLDDRHVRIDV